jgi:hypothetical protein
MILKSAVRVNGNYGQLMCDCYELLLEAGLHCGKAWETFTQQDDLEEVHYSLLLVQPVPVVRSTIWQLMKIKLDRFSPYVLSDSSTLIYFLTFDGTVFHI